MEERPGIWALYFDIGDDGLKSKVASGMRVLELELSRKEKRFQKEREARQHDQTTQRAVDTKADAPVDQPLVAEALDSRPGVIDTLKDSAVTVRQPLRPLKIPRSIFDDPPPMVAPLPFRPTMPKTPPPAYSPVFPENSFRSVGMFEQESIHRHPQAESTDKSSTPESPPPVQSSAPPNGPSISPLEPSNTSPIKGKRATPKLNRSSGTKALAKVQMFEPMAAELIPRDGLREKSPDRAFQPNSKAGYASSEYSNDGQDITESIQQEVGISAQSRMSSPTLAPPVRPMTKGKSPMVHRQVSIGLTPGSGSSVQSPNTISKPRTLRTLTDPAVSAGRPETVRPLNLIRRPSILRQQSTTGSASRSSSPKSAQNALVSRQRQRSASNQSYMNSNPNRSLPKPTPQTIPQPARTSLARTMTTGSGNRGMTNRLAERTVANVPVRGRANTAQISSRAVSARNTTSALFREIDELIKQDTSLAGAEAVSK